MSDTIEKEDYYYQYHIDNKEKERIEKRLEEIINELEIDIKRSKRLVFEYTRSRYRDIIYILLLILLSSSILDIYTITRTTQTSLSLQDEKYNKTRIIILTIVSICYYINNQFIRKKWNRIIEHLAIIEQEVESEFDSSTSPISSSSLTPTKTLLRRRNGNTSPRKRLLLPSGRRSLRSAGAENGYAADAAAGSNHHHHHNTSNQTTTKGVKFMENTPPRVVTQDSPAATEAAAKTAEKASMNDGQSPSYHDEDESLLLKLRTEGYTLKHEINITSPKIDQEGYTLINELRTRISQNSTYYNGNEDWCNNDQNLWRFLIARRKDVNNAYKQLEAALQWRCKRKPDEITCEMVENEALTGKISIRGKDKWGRPVIVLDSSYENSKSFDGQMNFLTHSIERAIRMMDGDVQKYVVVVRLGETSPFNFSKLGSPAATRETLKIMVTVYCERLGTAICYKPPKIFTLFLKLFRAFLDERTMSKVAWVVGNVDDNSSNDNMMKDILGDNWKYLIGECQPKVNKETCPGYFHDEMWKVVVEEEEQWLLLNNSSNNNGD